MNKEQLHQLYIIEKQSLRTIASKLGVSAPTVQNYLKKFGLQTRSISEALTGRKLSEEHNRNKTKAQTGSGNPFYGKNLSEETRDKIRQKHIGKKMSAESRKKMSETRKGNPKYSGENHPLYGKSRPDMTGKNHPRWNGGISNLYTKIRRNPRYINWKKSCLKRDGHTCISCGSKENLHVDHIKPFALIIKENNVETAFQAGKCQELWKVDNGRTLCETCHVKTGTHGQGTKRLLNELSARKD